MDPFDSTLRERMVRLLAAAPGDPARPPELPASARPDAWRHAWKVGSGRVRVGGGTWPSRFVLGGLAAAVLLMASVVGLAWSPADTRAPAGYVPVAGAVVDDGTPIVWESEFARLRADSLRIKADGKVFTAAGIMPARVSSDSGSKRYGTLEVIWHEHGVEMRMDIYFAADQKEWWATEVRVYDGSVPGDWIGWGGDFSTSQGGRPSPSVGNLTSRLRALGVPADAEIVALGGDGDSNIFDVVYRDGDGQRHRITCDRSEEQAGCPPPLVDLGLFRSPLGEAWTGDLDLVDGSGMVGDERQTSGELHIRGLRLSAFP
jgi:hypothetical protein